MSDATDTLFWRRLDLPGLERLALTRTGGGLKAESTLLCLEGGGFRLDYQCRMDAEWRVLGFEIERLSQSGRQSLRLERAGTRWTVDGAARPDLDRCEEPDLSATPFCNTLPIRRMSDGRSSLELDVCYIDADRLTVERSRQRYERLGSDRFRYIDLGLHAGFQAELSVDAGGLIRVYEGLFERAWPTPLP